MRFSFGNIGFLPGWNLHIVLKLKDWGIQDLFLDFLLQLCLSLKVAQKEPILKQTLWQLFRGIHFSVGILKIFGGALSVVIDMGHICSLDL